MGIDSHIAVTIGSTGYRDVPKDQVFSAVSYDAVTSVLRDNTHYDTSAILKAHLPFLGKTMTAMDGDEHRRNRNLVSVAFSRPTVERWTETIVRDVATANLQRFLAVAEAHGGTADLLRDFLADYPAKVITDIIGLPESDLTPFIKTALAMVTFSDFELASSAAQVMFDWITSLAHDARQRPHGQGLISLLAHVEVDGDRLSDDEIAAFIRILFVAGFETTVQGFANSLVGLLTSGQWELVRDDRTLVKAAVDEGLRWQTSVLGMPRVAREDQMLFGVHVPKGSVVLCFTAAANHDPDRWEHPERFDLTRPGLNHVAFGFGPHLCLGMPLAKAEIATGLNLLLDAVPDLRLADGSADDVRVRGLATRGPRAIPVATSSVLSPSPR
jgi:cytochrome P450